MKKDDCYFVGKITQPHGVRGEVKVWLDVDDPIAYENLASVFLEIKGQLVPYMLDEIQVRGRKSIARFEGMKTWEDAQKIIGADLYLPLNTLPELDDTQFYYHDIVGYQVVEKATNEIYGSVTAVYESTGQDLLAVDVQGKEALIPITDSIVLGVDKAAKYLWVALPEGLLDIYLEETKQKPDDDTDDEHAD